MAIDLSELTRLIQRNCDISDANYAGVYSLCGLLLRLRDLYKWDHGLPPWREPEPSDLMDWIDERERLWEEIAGADLNPLLIDGEVFDPFDVVGVNDRLLPTGFIYGAGYGVGMKPTFFLAESSEPRVIDNLRIDTIERELARDIFSVPAMRQGDRIFARPSAMLFFLWDQLLEMRPSARDALNFAFSRFGLDVDEVRSRPDAHGSSLDEISRNQLETWVYHEIGEAGETAFEGHVWHEIVSAYSNSPVEIFARVIKDLLADTHPEGLLGHITANRIESSLGFYVAFLRPFMKAVFPEIIEAFRRFVSSGDWSLVERAAERGREKAVAGAAKLVELHEAGIGRDPEITKRKIISDLIEPLGISVILRDGEPDDD